MRVEGIKQFETKLKNLPKDLERKVDGVVSGNANEMRANAVRRFPSRMQMGTKEGAKGERRPTQNIGQTITAQPKGKMTWEVAVNSKMGAYIEFGTGAFVDVPQGWEDIAWSYYVNGKGLIMPTPFFYPSYREQSKKFINDLRKVLNEES